MAESKKDVKEETKKAKSVPKQPTPIKPYIHVDTFLKTAIPLFGMSNVQAAGFRALMNGRQYQRDEQVFVDELKAYLKIK